MDTDSLRLFVRAADRLNISAAGRDLGLAPAVASAGLAKLEREVEAELLHRSTRKVSISIEGEVFLPFAREILAQRDAAMAALGHGKARPEGTIRFAASSTFAQLYLPPCFRSFSKEIPDCDMTFGFSDTPVRLARGQLRPGSQKHVLDNSSLKARKLAIMRGIMCASPQYLAHKGIPEHPDDLGQHDLLAFRSLRKRTLVRSDGEKAMLICDDRNCRVVVDDGAAMRLAAIAGLGISTHADWNVHHALQEGSLRRVLPEWHVDDDTALWLVYPKSNILTAKVRVLIDFLVDRVGRNPQWQQDSKALEGSR